ncbi:MAG: hypothetical protein O6746_04810 [Thaumarchaeota archaeon]|nr:hypothetical protein [Nitrososphaerota archaeon]
MDSQMIQNVIREPTTDKVSDIMSEITPGVIGDIMPAIFGEVDGGKSSEIIAEQTLDQIFNIVETEVLGEGVDFVIERYGDRIIDLVTGNMFSIFERVTMMIFGS